MAASLRLEPYGPDAWLLRFAEQPGEAAFQAAQAIRQSLETEPPDNLLEYVLGSDLRNNGLALYFSRPIRRWEYALGKALVLGILLSLITWIPGTLLFLFQSYLEGFDWMTENYRVGIGILLGHGIWITVLCLISLAISAYVKWKPVARLMLILLIFVAGGVAALTNFLLRSG